MEFQNLLPVVFDYLFPLARLALLPGIPSPWRTTTQDCWITHQCHKQQMMAFGKPMLTWLTLRPRGKGFLMAFPAYEVMN